MYSLLFEWSVTYASLRRLLMTWHHCHGLTTCWLLTQLTVQPTKVACRTPTRSAPSKWALAYCVCGLLLPEGCKNFPSVCWRMRAAPVMPMRVLLMSVRLRQHQLLLLRDLRRYSTTHPFQRGRRRVVNISPIGDAANSWRARPSSKASFAWSTAWIRLRQPVRPPSVSSA